MEIVRRRTKLEVGGHSCSNQIVSTELASSRHVRRRAAGEWEVCGEASNGADAVELFKELHPNLVIVDFQMPGMNGIDTARRLLQVAPAVPIIMFTQHASNELEKHALDAGIRSVVSKTDAFPIVGIIEALLDPIVPLQRDPVQRDI